MNGFGARVSTSELVLLTLHKMPLAMLSMLPQVGTVIVSDLAFAEVESTKSVSDIFAPIAGEIVEVNQVLEDEPELINEDPYGDGWVCLIKPADINHLELLMDAERYLAFISQDSEA